jgi:hypothetical protein
MCPDGCVQTDMFCAIYQLMSLIESQLLVVTMFRSRCYRFVLVYALPVLFTTVTIAGISSPVSANPPVSQARKRRYVPQQDRRAPKRTEAGGTRGCSTNAQSADMQLLVPRSNIGHTVSDRPTFTWYIDNPRNVELPVQFSLIAPGVLKPIYQQTLTATQSGIMQVTLPQDAPALKPNQPYRWMVSWSCDQLRPAEPLNRRAWVERLAPSPELTQNIQTAKTIPDRITAYAQSGLWQEAIDLAATHRQDPQVQPLWQELLEDGELPAIQ